MYVYSDVCLLNGSVEYTLPYIHIHTYISMKGIDGTPMYVSLFFNTYILSQFKFQDVDLSHLGMNTYIDKATV